MTTDKKMSPENIIRTLVKVKLTVRCWNGKYISKTLSSDLANRNQAEPGSVDVNIVYLPERYSKPVTSAISQLRSFWVDNTLPWEEEGWRIVSSKKYQQLMDGTVERKHTFDQAVEDIITNYDEVYEASKIRLAALFNANKFPSRSQLQTKYGIYIYRNSVNAADDVRIDGLGDAVVSDIRKDVEKQYSDQLCTAVESITERLREVATDIVERTSKPSEDVKFGTLLTKINKTCDSLDGLNIIGDTRINEMIDHMRQLSKDNSAGVLKVNDVKREEMKKQAKDILSALDVFGMS